MRKALALLAVLALALSAAGVWAHAQGAPLSTGHVEKALNPAPAGDQLFAFTEYSLPVDPLNLRMMAHNRACFSSPAGNAVGTLDMDTRQVTIYPRATSGAVWGVLPDAQGNIWYTAVNPGTLGKLEPTSGSMTEWRLPGTTNTYGLDIDPNTGRVWCASNDLPALFCLDPGAMQLTQWLLPGSGKPFDVGVSADGKVWYSTHQTGMQGLGRLDPATRQLTLYPTCPGAVDCAPFRLETADSSVYFSDQAGMHRGVAGLNPQAQMLWHWLVPPEQTGLFALVHSQSNLWFCGSGANTVSMLPLVGTPFGYSYVFPQTQQATALIVPELAEHFSSQPLPAPSEQELRYGTRTEINGVVTYHLPYDMLDDSPETGAHTASSALGALGKASAVSPSAGESGALPASSALGASGKASAVSPSAGEAGGAAPQADFDPTGLAAEPGSAAMWYADRVRKVIGRIDPSAPPLPTLTPTATPTATPTLPPAPTSTPTATQPAAGTRLYLPLILRRA